jgi:hypothetical protein
MVQLLVIHKPQVVLVERVQMRFQLGQQQPQLALVVIMLVVVVVRVTDNLLLVLTLVELGAQVVVEMAGGLMTRLVSTPRLHQQQQTQVQVAVVRL